MIQEKGYSQTSEAEVFRLNRDFPDPRNEGTYRTSVVLFSAALSIGRDIDAFEKVSSQFSTAQQPRSLATP